MQSTRPHASLPLLGIDELPAPAAHLDDGYQWQGSCWEQPTVWQPWVTDEELLPHTVTVVDEEYWQQFTTWPIQWANAVLPIDGDDLPRFFSVDEEYCWQGRQWGQGQIVWPHVIDADLLPRPIIDEEYWLQLRLWSPWQSKSQQLALGDVSEWVSSVGFDDEYPWPDAHQAIVWFGEEEWPTPAVPISIDWDGWWSNKFASTEFRSLCCVDFEEVWIPPLFASEEVRAVNDRLRKNSLALNENIESGSRAVNENIESGSRAVNDVLR